MNSKLKENIGSYIWRKFGTLGLLTGAQMFKPRQFTHLHSGTDPPATNIVGILPGARWGTPEDRLVVVGAHWDTVLNTGGLDDNGSGVSAMLELGRRNLSDITSVIVKGRLLNLLLLSSAMSSGPSGWLCDIFLISLFPFADICLMFTFNI